MEKKLWCEGYFFEGLDWCVFLHPPEGGRARVDMIVWDVNGDFVAREKFYLHERRDLDWLITAAFFGFNLGRRRKNAVQEGKQAESAHGDFFSCPRCGNPELPKPLAHSYVIQCPKCQALLAWQGEWKQVPKEVEKDD